jgi:hypothetical protein
MGLLVDCFRVERVFSERREVEREFEGAQYSQTSRVCTALGPVALAPAACSMWPANLGGTDMIVLSLRAVSGFRERPLV